MAAYGRFDDARRTYNEVMGVCDSAGRQAGGGKDGAWVNASRGHALGRLGRTAEAEKCYRDAIAADPGSPLPVLELATLVMLDGRHDEALILYQRAIDMDPQYVPAHAYRGHALLVQRKADGGQIIECYKGALEISSEEVSAYAGIGMVMARTGRHDEAVKRFEDAIELDPLDPLAYTGLGHALAGSGRHAEAIKAYGKAIESGAMFGLEQIAMSRSTAQEGDDMASRAMISMGIAAAYKGLGDALLKTGDYKEAMIAHRQAAYIDAGSAKAHVGLGAALHAAGRHEEAVFAYQRAAQIDAGSAKAHQGLGRALFRMGMNREARASYRRADEIRVAAGHLDKDAL